MDQDDQQTDRRTQRNSGTDLCDVVYGSLQIHDLCIAHGH